MLSIAQMPPLTWGIESGMLAIFTLSVKDSAVSVDCEVPAFNPSDFQSLHLRALDVARTSINLYVFATGFAHTVSIQSFRDPDGNVLPIRAINPDLGQLCTSYNLFPSGKSEEARLGKVVKIIFESFSVFVALSDLVQAITVQHQAPISCARAVEGLRREMDPGPKNKAWVFMQDNLQLSESFLQQITDMSRGPRHGDPTSIPSTEVKEVISKSWIVMDRFLEFRARGSQPLPLAEFPLLF